MEPKARLLKLIDDLTQEDALGADDQKTVILDQTSVGRLSRMDALQRQAMAKATQARRAISLIKLKAALDRIEAGEYGFCTECGEDIDAKRLDLDPAAPRCLSCTQD